MVTRCNLFEKLITARSNLACYILIIYMDLELPLDDITTSSAYFKQILTFKNPYKIKG